MPSHAPRSEPVRKREILEKRELELRHAIRHGLSIEKVSAAAEKVRFAKLKLCKALIGPNLSCRLAKGAFHKGVKGYRAYEEKEAWETMPVAQIIELYEGDDGH